MFWQSNYIMEIQGLHMELFTSWQRTSSFPWLLQMWIRDDCVTSGDPLVFSRHCNFFEDVSNSQMWGHPPMWDETLYSAILLARQGCRTPWRSYARTTTARRNRIQTRRRNASRATCALKASSIWGNCYCQSIVVCMWSLRVDAAYVCGRYWNIYKEV